MTIIDRRERQAKLFPDPCLSLPSICLLVRDSLRGSVDGMDYLQIADAVNLLRMAVQTWEPAQPDDMEIEAAILSLIKATLRYATAR